MPDPNEALRQLAAQNAYNMCNANIGYQPYRSADNDKLKAEIEHRREFPWTVTARKSGLEAIVGEFKSRAEAETLFDVMVESLPEGLTVSIGMANV